MTLDRFWSIIADSRRDFDPNRRDGNMDLQAERLEQLLSAMPVGKVQEFDRIFWQLVSDAYRWDLWAAAYIIQGGCSDDAFMDFREWLVSMGREAYEALIADPESLGEISTRPGIEYTGFEGFGGIARRVLEKRGAPVLAVHHPPEGAAAGTSEHPHPDEPLGEPWEEDDLPERLPGLWAEFGEAEK